MPKAAALVVPGRLDSRTGGYIYDRHIVDGLRAKGWTADVVSLDESFPRPTPAAAVHADEVLAALPPSTVTLIDSLALGAMPGIVERHASRLRIVALVHLALAAAAIVIVTGHATLGLLARYALPRDRIFVVEPGTDPAPLARGSGGSPLHLLSVATLNPGKGHIHLLTALAAVPSRHWQLTCAGSLTRSSATAARVEEVIRELELGDRVSLVGDLDRSALEEQYDRSDVFVLATLRETYGMAVAEALAHGLPVVSTRTGAIPELVGSDAGLVVTTGDVAGLTDALSRVIVDGDLRARLAAGARRVRPLLPTWDATITKMEAALDAIAHG
jgi:glycosyltransferase involved in cell wall biosynthesis